MFILNNIIVNYKKYRQSNILCDFANNTFENTFLEVFDGKLCKKNSA